MFNIFKTLFKNNINRGKNESLILRANEQNGGKEFVEKNNEKAFVPLQLKFEDEYTLLADTSNLNVGDIIPVIIKQYDRYTGKITCHINHNIMGFMSEDNFSLNNQKRVDNAIYSHIKKIVLGQIININADGTYELDRKIVLEKTINELLLPQLYNVIEAKITSCYRYGVFVDLGNGVNSMVHITDLSRSKYQHIDTYLKEGDIIKIRLIDFDPNTKKFKSSRKDAYEHLTFKNSFKSYVIVGEPTPANNGFFVEYNPNTLGIVDNPDKLDIKSGEKRLCYILPNPKFPEKSFKGFFIE